MLISKILSALSLFFTFSISMMYSMESLQLSEKDPRPTIEAKIWLEEKAAFYLTKDQIARAQQQGIIAPIVPIGLLVRKVKVIQEDKTIRNWKKFPPDAVISYETAQIQKSPLSLVQRFEKAKAMFGLTFPEWLPAECALHCSNGSKISLTIHGFPVQATFESNDIFHKQYEQSMNEFYAKPYLFVLNLDSFVLNLGDTEEAAEALRGLIQENLLQQIETDFFTSIFSILDYASQNQLWLPFTHGSQGCPDAAHFLKLLKEDKTKKYCTQTNRNMTSFFLQRQVGQKITRPNTQNPLEYTRVSLLLASRYR
jgi:hypothetical protein